MSVGLNMSSYNNALSQMGGKKRRFSRLRKRRSRGRRRSSRQHQNQNQNQNQNQSQNQNGGFFPGIGEVISQAVVPFGLYAVQHKFKSRKNKSPANYSLKKFKKFKFTRRV